MAAPEECGVKGGEAHHFVVIKFAAIAALPASNRYNNGARYKVIARYGTDLYGLREKKTVYTVSSFQSAGDLLPCSA